MNKSNVDLINDSYDHYMFGTQRVSFDKIGFFNFGYWKGIDGSIELAQINLIETLISFFPDKSGTVLDVACGKGASTKYLTKYFDPRNITGINISERQLEVCRVVAPECTFKLMDATRLDFQESSLDNLLCIEAAPHFMTRYEFLKETYRVLRAGGRLSMSDMLYDKYWLDLIGPAHPKENYLKDLEAYRELLREIGFKYIRVEDSTDFGMKALAQFETRRLETHFCKRPEREVLEEIEKWRDASDHMICCMVYAIK